MLVVTVGYLGYSCWSHTLGVAHHKSSHALHIQLNPYLLSDMRSKRVVNFSCFVMLMVENAYNINIILLSTITLDDNTRFFGNVAR